MGYEPRCTGTKVCTKCEQELPALAFHADRTKRDGLYSCCRSCHSESVKGTPLRKRRDRERARRKVASALNMYPVQRMLASQDPDEPFGADPKKG